MPQNPPPLVTLEGTTEPESGQFGPDSGITTAAPAADTEPQEPAQ